MNLGRFFRNQFSQVIEWKDQQPDVLLQKHPSDNDEVKDASKLLVGPGQGAIVVYEGKVADHITEEGLYDLESDNHPFITTLLKLRTLFESEHKLKIWFYRTAEVLNQGWGTAQPVKYQDPVYKMPVQLGANGSFSFRIADPVRLFDEVVGSQHAYDVRDARQVLQSRFPQYLAGVLAGSGLSYQHIDAQLPQLASRMQEQLAPEVGRLGFELTDFKLNGTLFDADTQDRIDRVSDMTADSRAAAEGGLSYAEMERLRALRDAARNQGGLAGMGLQWGAGLELGRLFSSLQAGGTGTPPPTTDRKSVV